MSSNDARLKHSSLWLAAFVFSIALLTLVGWIFSIPHLTTLLLTTSTMKPNTALALMLAATALALLNRENTMASPWTPRVLAALVSIIGVVTLAESVFHSDAGIDEWLMQYRRIRRIPSLRGCRR
jgi:hypothetical protein